MVARWLAVIGYISEEVRKIAIVVEMGIEERSGGKK